MKCCCITVLRQIMNKELNVVAFMTYLQHIDWKIHTVTNTNKSVE